MVAAIIAAAGLSAAPAQGQEVRYFWVNTCQDHFTCVGDPPETPRFCSCQVEWDDVATWIACIWDEGGCIEWEEPPNSYPDESHEDVKIEHSTTDSRCDGGIDHGSTCTSDGQCRKTCVGGTNDGQWCAKQLEAACIAGGGTCTDYDCEPEQYLLINLTKDGSGQPITILNFTIKAEPSGSLDIRFESKDASNTLTAYTVTLDGNNGDVDMRVGDSAEINTDWSE